MTVAKIEALALSHRLDMIVPCRLSCPKNLWCPRRDQGQRWNSKFLPDVNYIMACKSVNLIVPAGSVLCSYVECLPSFRKVHCPVKLIAEQLCLYFSVSVFTLTSGYVLSACSSPISGMTI